MSFFAKEIKAKITLLHGKNQYRNAHYNMSFENCLLQQVFPNVAYSLERFKWCAGSVKQALLIVF